MNPIDPGARVLVHIADAEAWLRRAKQEWRLGARGRALLTLSLAEAEVRVARQEAMAAPLPARRASGLVRVALTVACAALAVVLGADMWSGLRWGGVEPVARNSAARPADARPVALSYVPGIVLRLVAPAPGSLSVAPRPLETETVAPDEFVPVSLTVSAPWLPQRPWPEGERLRLVGPQGPPTVEPTP